MVAGPVVKIQEPLEILKKAAAMEQESAAFYNAAAASCGELRDAASKQLFEALVGDEGGHFESFDRQIELINRFGPAYLALQSIGAEQPAATSSPS